MSQGCAAVVKPFVTGVLSSSVPQTATILTVYAVFEVRLESVAAGAVLTVCSLPKLLSLSFL
jgi:hypothetical protein